MKNWWSSGHKNVLLISGTVSITGNLKVLKAEEIEVCFYVIYLLRIYSAKPSAISEKFRQMDFASLGKLIKN